MNDVALLLTLLELEELAVEEAELELEETVTLAGSEASSCCSWLGAVEADGVLLVPEAAPPPLLLLGEDADAGYGGGGGGAYCMHEDAKGEAASPELLDAAPELLLVWWFSVWRRSDLASQ